MRSSQSSQNNSSAEEPELDKNSFATKCYPWRVIRSACYIYVQCAHGSTKFHACLLGVLPLCSVAAGPTALDVGGGGGKRATIKHQKNDACVNSEATRNSVFVPPFFSACRGRFIDNTRMYSFFVSAAWVIFLLLYMTVDLYIPVDGCIAAELRPRVHQFPPCVPRLVGRFPYASPINWPYVIY